MAVTGAPKRRPALVPQARTAGQARQRAPLASLIGREATLRRIETELYGGARVVTLTGPPGIGKTSVAAAYLDGRASRQGELAFFCDLSQATTAKELGLAVLALLHDRSYGEHIADEEVDARVGEVLAESGRMLIVLDNFEQLAFTAKTVERWCRAAPELRLLVTSRERLAIEGEVVVELTPLGCPPEGEQAATFEFDAVRLFVKRAHDAGGTVGDDPSVLGAIVRRLEGIPLAIELAAARTRLMSVEDLAARLAAGHGVLANVTRRADSRYATLTAAIDWSYRLLSPAEQTALARCSVFAGSFTLEAAERVIDSPDAFKMLGALRDKSLVHTPSEGRLGLYVSIRDHASNKLRELGKAEVHAARMRHARVFGEMAQRFGASRSMLDRAPDPTLHARMQREKENIAAALAFVRDLPPSEETSRLFAHLAVAAVQLHVLPAEACVAELSNALDALGPHRDSEAAALILLTRQSVYGWLGRVDDCLRDLETLRALENVPAGFALLALVYTGIQLRFRGSAREAWPRHAEAAVLLADADLPRLNAMNEACMGRLKGDLRDAALSRLHNERAYALGDAIGDVWLGALALANLAQLEQEEQNFERARELLLSAIERLRNAGEVHSQAIYSSVCGDLFFEWDNYAVARRWYTEGLRFFRAFLAHRQTAVAHGAAAALEAHDGDLVRARELLAIARRSATRAQNRVVDVVVELHTASVELAAADEARRDRVVGAWRRTIEACDHEDTAPGAIVATSFDARFALRMARRALARAAPAAQASDRTLRVAKDGRWFELGKGPRVELGRRGALRRILVALAEHRAAGGDRGLKQADLVSAGWPGERVLADAGATRVRVAIATLRRLGLRSTLLTRDDGYVLDADTRLATED